MKIKELLYFERIKKISSSKKDIYFTLCFNDRFFNGNSMFITPSHSYSQVSQPKLIKLFPYSVNQKQ